MAKFFFARRNDVSGEYINVLGERFSVKELDENHVKCKRYKKRTYKNLKEFLKYCNLKKVY